MLHKTKVYILKFYLTIKVLESTSGTALGREQRLRTGCTVCECELCVVCNLKSRSAKCQQNNKLNSCSLFYTAMKGSLTTETGDTA